MGLAAFTGRGLFADVFNGLVVKDSLPLLEPVDSATTGLLFKMPKGVDSLPHLLEELNVILRTLGINRILPDRVSLLLVKLRAY
jgi:hypothetical protein